MGLRGATHINGARVMGMLDGKERAVRGTRSINETTTSASASRHLIVGASSRGREAHTSITSRVRDYLPVVCWLGSLAGLIYVPNATKALDQHASLDTTSQNICHDR